MLHTPLLTRIRGEYLEMPGLRLTFAQAQRLFGVDRMLCEQLLAALVEANFLCLKPDGAYVRVMDADDVFLPRAAKADLRTSTRGTMAS